MSYKIIRGYGTEDYLEIEDSELEKAYYCFLEKKDSIFSGGAIKGSQILAIQPDFHKTMGWNRGYKLDEYDYADMNEKGIDKKLQHLLSETKEKVQYLIETNQTHLIGKNADFPRIENSKEKEISQATKMLAQKFSV
jgi:hypothetical protein